jgi:hypothetical protein
LSPFNCVKASLLLNCTKIQEIFRNSSKNYNKIDSKQQEKDGVRIKVKDVYRNNQEYHSLSDDQKQQILQIVESLKKSKVLKVCKDKFNIKRRIPFKKDAKITQYIDSCTVYIESASVELSLDNLSKFLKKYKPRDLRLKNEFAFAELDSPESVAEIMKDSSSNEYTILTKG